jgi:hypothetical protein
MPATSITSLKSAITTRINPANAERLYNESRVLGNPAVCPLSAQAPDVDVYSRPQGGARYRLLYLGDAACSHFVYPTSQRLKHESAQRPIIGPCNPGDRGAGDFLYGSVRDRFPQNLYGQGTRGNFVNTYVGMRPADGPPPMYTTSYEQATARAPTMSHDALITPYFG